MPKLFLLMRMFLILFGHELRMLVLTPASYIAAGLFLTVLVFLYTLSIQAGGRDFADSLPVSLFFQLFFVPVSFMVPLLTMRTLAEERRLGTLQSLLTTAVSPVHVVLAKYLAAYLFYLGMWALTLGFPVLLERQFAEVVDSARLFDGAALAGGYAFIAITGLLYVAIGIFCSGLTRSQLVAGMLTFVVLFFLTLGPAMLPDNGPGSGFLFDWIREPLAFFKAFDHLKDFSRGVVDTRPILLYVSVTVMLLGATVVNVDANAGTPT